MAPLFPGYVDGGVFRDVAALDSTANTLGGRRFAQHDAVSMRNQSARLDVYVRTHTGTNLCTAVSIRA